MNPPADIINENQRRAIGITLALLDEIGCGIERWAQGGDVGSVLYEVRNPLTRSQRAVLLEQVSRIRSVLAELADALRLPRQVHSATDDIWGQCAAFREHLMELEGGRFKGYGEVHPELQRLLDEKIPALIQAVDRIAHCVAKSRPARRRK